MERVVDLRGALVPGGLLVRPRGARALLVLAHGAGAGMRHAFLADLARGLAAHGVATLRWEFPYMAAGKRRPDAPELAEAAVREAWAASARFRLPRFAGGKSFGGRMTSRAHAAASLPGAHGLVLIGYPLVPAGGDVRRAAERAAHLPRAAGPLLFVSGDRDLLAPLLRLRPVVRGLGPRAALHVIAGADHGFDVLARSGRTRADVQAELAGTIAAWIAENLRGHRRKSEVDA